MNPMDNFSNMFGKIAPGMCRLAYNGGIAIKTNEGYKKYDIETGSLINCSSFVLDVGEDMFFIIPTKKAKEGDLLLVNGSPVCVIKAEKNMLTVFRYEDSTIANIIPERHIFMGNTFLYTKIVSIFGDMKKKGGMKGFMKFMMMSQMMKGSSGSTMDNLLPLMMMSGGKFDLFDNFDFDLDDDDESEDEE